MNFISLKFYVFFIKINKKIADKAYTREEGQSNKIYTSYMLF